MTSRWNVCSLRARRLSADAEAVARSHTTILLALLALVLLAAVRHAGAGTHRTLGPEPRITKEVRQAGLRFAPDVLPADRQLVLHEIELARPEARRLIAIADGLVTVHVGDTSASGADTIGLTESTLDGFTVTLNLAAVYAGAGERGVQRLVLHELGHVVDRALVKPDLAQRLDAPIPAGYGCDPMQPDVGCAPRPERFAETFSKWATGDIGINLPIGYKVAPPTSLEDWGAQLVSGIGAA
jgi:hypothetical protein